MGLAGAALAGGYRDVDCQPVEAEENDAQGEDTFRHILLDFLCKIPVDISLKMSII